MSNQLKEYGRYRQQLEIQDLREQENARQRGARGTPEQQLEIKKMEVQARKDISWWTQQARGQDAATQARSRDLVARITGFYKEQSNAGKEFPYTKDDMRFKEELKRATNAPGALDRTGPQPGAGGVQTRPAAPAPAPAPTPAPVPRTGGSTAAPPPPEPVLPPGVKMEDYKGDKPPTANGLQLPPDSPYAWAQSKSTKEWQLRPNPYYTPPKPK
jgi:hypothetical protein